jgi:hypothetical protein
MKSMVCLRIFTLSAVQDLLAMGVWTSWARFVISATDDGPCHSARRRRIQPRLPGNPGLFVSSLQEAQCGGAGDGSFEAEGGDVMQGRLASRYPGGE